MDKSEINQVYEHVLSLPAAEQPKALSGWWKFLESICTEEHPCPECKVELERGE